LELSLIHIYSTDGGSGLDGTLPDYYVTYSLSKPRIWSANAAKIYNWWLQRSNAQMTASYSTSGGQSITTLSISGNSNTNAAVELVAPSLSLIHIFLFVGQGVSPVAGLHGGQLFKHLIQHVNDLMGMIHPNRLGCRLLT